MWEQLELALIAADCGVPATVTVIERLEAEAAAGRLTTSADLTGRLTEIVAELMTPEGDPRIDVTHKPSVILMARRQRHRQDDVDRQDRLASA